MRAALSKIAATRHKNNKWRLWRWPRSHTDGEIFHASHPFTFKWTAPEQRLAAATCQDLHIRHLSTFEPERQAKQAKVNQPQTASTAFAILGKDPSVSM